MTQVAHVRLEQLPVALHQRAAAHLDELLRELTFAASDTTDTPARVVGVGAALLDRSSVVMTPLAHTCAAAVERGDVAVDVAFTVSDEAPAVARTADALLDEAEGFCRHGDLLTLAAPDDVVAYRRWFLHEFVRQCAGAPPTPWPASAEADALDRGQVRSTFT